MRHVEKTYVLETFPPVSMRKDALFRFIESIKRNDETVEIRVSDTIFESIDEARAHPESLSFPMEVKIGEVTLTFEKYQNSVSSKPESRARVAVAVKELHKFRNPLRWLNSSIGFAFLMIFVLLSLTICFGVVVRLVAFKPSEGLALGIIAAFVIAAFFVAFRVSLYGENALKNNATDTFLRRNSEKIILPVLSSLLTAGVYWLITNWASLQAAIGLSP